MSLTHCTGIWMLIGSDLNQISWIKMHKVCMVRQLRDLHLANCKVGSLINFILVFKLSCHKQNKKNILISILYTFLVIKLSSYFFVLIMVADFLHLCPQTGTTRWAEGLSLYEDCCYPPFLMTCKQVNLPESSLYDASSLTEEMVDC